MAVREMAMLNCVLGRVYVSLQFSGSVFSHPGD